MFESFSVLPVYFNYHYDCFEVADNVPLFLIEIANETIEEYNENIREGHADPNNYDKDDYLDICKVIWRRGIREQIVLPAWDCIRKWFEKYENPLKNQTEEDYEKTFEIYEEIQPYFFMFDKIFRSPFSDYYLEKDFEADIEAVSRLACLLWKNKIYDIEDEETPLKDCAICLEENETIKTSCGHFFCKDCIEEWNKTKTTCPLCRQTFYLDNFIDKIYEAYEEDEQEFAYFIRMVFLWVKKYKEICSKIEIEIDEQDENGLDWTEMKGENLITIYTLTTTNLRGESFDL